MKISLTIIFAVICGYWTARITHPSKHPVQIVKLVTDERGLISVMFIQKSDTLALDYITVKELNQLVNQ